MAIRIERWWLHRLGLAAVAVLMLPAYGGEMEIYVTTGPDGVEIFFQSASWSCWKFRHRSLGAHPRSECCWSGCLGTSVLANGGNFGTGHAGQ